MAHTVDPEQIGQRLCLRMRTISEYGRTTQPLWGTVVAIDGSTVHLTDVVMELPNGTSYQVTGVEMDVDMSADNVESVTSAREPKRG